MEYQEQLVSAITRKSFSKPDTQSDSSLRGLQILKENLRGTKIVPKILRGMKFQMPFPH